MHRLIADSMTAQAEALLKMFAPKSARPSSGTAAAAAAPHGAETAAAGAPRAGRGKRPPKTEPAAAPSPEKRPTGPSPDNKRTSTSAARPAASDDFKTTPDSPLGLKTIGPQSVELFALLSSPEYTPTEGLNALSKLTTPPSWRANGKGTLGDEYMEVVNPGYLLGKHTLDVANQLEKYFSTTPPQAGLSLPAYRLLALLHDAGKAAARRIGHTGDQQYFFTKTLIEHLRPHLPLPDATLDRMLVILGSDPIGPYLRTDHKQAGLETTLELIAEGARQTGMTPSGYLDALLPYYQSDASAYTSDAGSTAMFDSVFKRHGGGGLTTDTSKRNLEFNGKRLVFGFGVEPRWQALERATQDMSRTWTHAPAESTARGGGPKAAPLFADGTGQRPRSMSDLKLVKGKGTSQLRQDATGQLWMANPDSTRYPGHAAELALADSLYRSLGMGTYSEVFPGATGTLYRVAPKIKDAVSYSSAARANRSVVADAQSRFAGHALLGHKEIYEGDGKVMMAGGKLTVVDPSGALRRAPDGRNRKFTPVPLELWTMREGSNVFSNVRWQHVVGQMEALTDQARWERLERAAGKDPALQRTLNARLDNMSYLVEATKALRKNGIRDWQIERELRAVMENVAKGGRRPPLPDLAASVKFEPARLPRDAAMRLSLASPWAGARLEVGNPQMRILDALSSCPSGSTYRVETDAVGAEGLPLMTVLHGSSLDQLERAGREAIARKVLLGKDPFIQGLFPGVLPTRIVQLTPGVLFHSELPGVPYGQVDKAAQGNALQQSQIINAAAEYAPGMGDTVLFDADSATAHSGFDKTTGKLLGWHGFLVKES